MGRSVLLGGSEQSCGTHPFIYDGTSTVLDFMDDMEFRIVEYKKGFQPWT